MQPINLKVLDKFELHMVRQFFVIIFLHDNHVG